MITNTGILDTTGTEIQVGDEVKSEYGYNLIVESNEEQGYYGLLVCDENDSCRDIPYSLTGQLTIVKKSK
jgi:hypothetical protein